MTTKLPSPLTITDALTRLDAIDPDRFWINENRDHGRPAGPSSGSGRPPRVTASHYYIHDELEPRECLGSGATLDIAIENALRRLKVKTLAAIVRNDIHASKPGVPAGVGLDSVPLTASAS